MVVYGGVWWCVPWCMLVYGGVDAETLPGSTSPIESESSESESSESEQTPAIYNAENLPAEVEVMFTARETKKYRDYVCSHYKLHYVQVPGNGNCFFLSVAMLLDIDPTDLRQQLVEWLRQCEASHDPISQDCCVTMEREVQVPLIKLVGKKWVERSPATVLEYLKMSSEDGVWVAGRISPNTAIHHPTGTTFAHTPPHRHTPSCAAFRHTPPHRRTTVHHTSHNNDLRNALAIRGRNDSQGLCCRGNSPSRIRPFVW